MAHPTTPDAPQRARLSGNLGTGSIAFMVIAAAAPLTVIGGNAPLAIGQGNGAGAPVGFLIASIVLLLFAVGFVAMTPFVKEAGAFFSYVTVGLGSRLGMGTAYVALIAYTAIQAGIYGYMGWAVMDLVRYYGGPEIHWSVFAVLALVVVGLLGYRHIDLSSKVLGVALLLEILVMMIVNVAVLVNGGPEGLAPQSFDPQVFLTSGIGVAILFALTGFIGFESTAIYRDEAREPSRTIPRATYLAVAIIGVFYTLSVWVLVVAAGASNVTEVAQQTLFGSKNMLLDTAGDFAGAFTRNVMQILLITSLFACVLSFHNIVARYQFALAKIGSMPAPLSRVHVKHQSPALSSLVQSVTALVIIGLFVVIGLDPLVEVFGYMAGVATIGMVMMMLLTTVAVVVFFVRNPRLRKSIWTGTVLPVVAVAALGLAAWLVLSNFTMVTGGSLAVSIVLALIPPAALVAGAIVNRKDGGRTVDIQLDRVLEAESRE
ncbi:APC family permease [Leucobacter chromiiresistens]|uniref:Amino acid transporter n=1 Tax=Leucobacter chromiiresistens TaxID=1079994 RepID=A0A147EAS9_9MICO|nr:APC family permease [Leucobacter chromiiresistens]KTR81492.1 amino acid transporter [Leucobacter chromiiresistens]